MKVLMGLLIFLFFSCSNNSSEDSIANPEDTLRKYSREYEKSINWVDGYSVSDTIEKKQTKLITNSNTTIDFTVHHFEKDTDTFPILVGFGSLDTQTIPNTLLNELNYFLESVKSKSIKSTSFSDNHQYLKTLTEYNLQSYPELKSYIIGKPTILSNTYEIPIQLKFEKYYANSKTYWKLENNSYKMFQIDIGALQNE